MKKKNIIFQVAFISLVFIAGCGDSKRPGLSDKDLMALECPEKQQKEEVSVIIPDSLIPSGVKYMESRQVNPATPPVSLSLSNPDNLEKKEFHVGDYFTKVKYITLAPPDTTTNLNGANVSFTDEHIFLAGLSFADKNIFLLGPNHGLQCYDRNGRFLATLAPPSNMKMGSGMDINEIKGFLGAYTTLGDDCLFVTWEETGAILHFYDIPSQTVYRQRKTDRNTKGLILLDHSKYAMIDFHALSEEEGFLTTFGAQGDTLCIFRNYMPKVTVKNAYTNPDPPFLYKLNNQHIIRQRYCDTIFRLSSERELTPVYVLNFGEKRCDKKTGLIGDKSDKLIPWDWVEGDRFIFFIYSENYDCPNTRNQNAITFFYTFYDKAARKLYRIPYAGYPEDFLISNPLPDGIPFFSHRIVLMDDKLRIKFSKNSLEELIAHEAFKRLPENQRDKALELHAKLGEDELLVMILE